MSFLREKEYDAFTGETKEWYFDDDKLHYRKTFDESVLVDHTKRLANETIDASFIGSKQRMHRMASIPNIIVEKIKREHGIDMLRQLEPGDERKLYRIIETEYPFLKTHTKKLWRPTRKPADVAV